MALLAGLGVLAGCGEPASGTGDGDGGSTVPTLTVQAGGDEISADPTQYCLDGDGQRYQTAPPILEVAPDTTIELTVSDAVAEAGWSVQVFDEELQEILGEVDVPAGEATFSEITTSDVVPPTFYLVVVEASDPDACSGLSGAWPVGFIRASVGGPETGPSGSPTG
ncbi:DUF2771 domain-containing protein [Modestobacter versicolor]|uniref:DUF2771 domain-containing protein n=1 Tax=Modestobacter versicolor TaxID=429133 RepID=A0A323V517_9ACTN|nr:DUF2771 domain-containing protein [Modestobacter versicolor]